MKKQIEKSIKAEVKNMIAAMGIEKAISVKFNDLDIIHDLNVIISAKCGEDTESEEYSELFDSLADIAMKHARKVYADTITEIADIFAGMNARIENCLS
jgi:hypothetical protein